MREGPQGYLGSPADTHAADARKIRGHEVISPSFLCLPASSRPLLAPWVEPAVSILMCRVSCIAVPLQAGVGNQDIMGATGAPAGSCCWLQMDANITSKDQVSQPELGSDLRSAT